MKSLTRRSFLKNSALAATATGFGLGSLKLPLANQQIFQAGHVAAFHAPLLAEQLLRGTTLSIFQRRNLCLLMLRDKIVGSLPANVNPDAHIEVDYVARDAAGRISLFVKIGSVQQMASA